MKYWEVIADNLSKAGWSWGAYQALILRGEQSWIADAHRGEGKRFVVRAYEKPMARKGNNHVTFKQLQFSRDSTV